MTPARAKWHFENSVGNAVLSAQVPFGAASLLGPTVNLYPFKREAAFLWVLWQPNGAGTVLSRCIAGGKVRTKILEEAAIAAIRMLVRKRHVILRAAA